MPCGFLRVSSFPTKQRASHSCCSSPQGSRPRSGYKAGANRSNGICLPSISCSQCFAHLLNQVGGLRISGGDELVHFGAGSRVNLAKQLRDIGQERAVLHRRRERGLQRLHAIVRDFGTDEERRTERFHRQENLEYL